MIDKIRRFFERIGEKMRKFMEGRYGIDTLNRVILATALILYIIGMIAKWPSRVVSLIYWVLLILWIFRAFSKNISARYKENEIFMRYVRFVKAVFAQGKDYKVYMCRCGRIIRVPKHHGTVEVTCPQCGAKKTLNTGGKK